MEDAETEEIIIVDTSNKKVRSDFTKSRLEQIGAVKKLLPSSGVDLINITTGSDYVKPLINFFTNRGKRK